MDTPDISAEQSKRWLIEVARSEQDSGIITPENVARLAQAEAEKEDLPPVESIEWTVVQLPTVTPRPPRPFTGSKNGRYHRASYTTGKIDPRNTTDVNSEIDD